MPKSALKEAYKKAIGTPIEDGGVSEEKKEAAKISESPLLDAFRKAKEKPVEKEEETEHEGLNPDDRLDGEEESDDYVPPYMKDEALLQKKIASKKEGAKVEPEEEEEEPEPEKPKKDPAILSMDDLKEISEDSLVDKQGRPATQEAWGVVKKLKHTLTHVNKLHATEIEELKKKTVSVTESEDFKKLQEENVALKKKFDDRYFEDSPDFVETYVTPFKEKEKELAEWIDSADLDVDSEEARDARIHIGTLHSALKSGDKIKYVNAVEELAELLPKGSAAHLRMAANELYPLYRKREEAIKDKDKTRKLLSTNELSVVDQSAVTINKTLDSLFDAYESENEKILEFYRSDNVKDIIKYDDVVTTGKDSVKSLVRELLSTRKPSEKLIRILADGILKPFKDNEVAALRAALKEKGDTVTELTKRLEKKGAALSKIATTKPSGGSRPSNDEEEEESDEDKARPLSAAFRKALASTK